MRNFSSLITSAERNRMHASFVLLRAIGITGIWSAKEQKNWKVHYMHHISLWWLYRSLPPQLFSTDFAIYISVPMFEKLSNYNQWQGYKSFCLEIPSSNLNVGGNDKVVALCWAVLEGVVGPSLELCRNLPM